MCVRQQMGEGWFNGIMHMAYFPCPSSSKRHVVCNRNGLLDLIKLYALPPCQHLYLSGGLTDNDAGAFYLRDYAVYVIKKATTTVAATITTVTAAMATTATVAARCEAFVKTANAALPGHNREQLSEQTVASCSASKPP